ncbi:MAG TPA: dihydroorotate dehydrogenase [Lachnospiraceae bacterium]|jgi:dihydroorotate dehydrogenase (NAD+) catalytic subunit|nr:dihydroorotate dehydrogenase [Lachnospiraceae bacterium]
MNTSVNIAGVEWKNPVTTSSGTFGSGEEYSDFFDLSELGAVTTKGVARVAWPGNDTPRVCETPSGMMNAIGLQNPGVDVFKERDLPFLSKFDTKIIVNVCGHTIEEYEEVVEKLNDTNADMFEINISCPNVQSGGMAFGQDRDMVEIITQSMKKRSKKPIIMKLSPNVGDIADMARAAEAGGADAISLVNTFLAMKIDINRRKFALANRTGGLSGPAIRPIAVRMVYDAAHAVKIPVIGMGGIQTSEDALEFIMAGATAVSVGTATFSNPLAARDVAVGIKNFMVKNKVEDIKELIGCVSQ